MKKILGMTAILFTLSSSTFAQENEGGNEHMHVPAVVKNANLKKYPESKTHHITWEKEKGNFEANWGGKDGEASSVTYTPSGVFIEIVKEIPTKDLPKGVLSYVKEHYKSPGFGDVGRVLDARGKTSYEVEINRKDVIFDENGNFVKEEK
ncbi:MAG TPA: PepSY-like domain-containing protein [Hanamia sp.]|nr:PepSY-like domain-containing protein [Hanamia sp.]